jgi:hypothetical protein
LFLLIVAFDREGEGVIRRTEIGVSAVPIRLETSKPTVITHSLQLDWLRCRWARERGVDASRLQSGAKPVDDYAHLCPSSFSFASDIARPSTILRVGDAYFGVHSLDGSTVLDVVEERKKKSVFLEDVSTVVESCGTAARPITWRRRTIDGTP